ncbi:hypothetical protein IPP75_01120 [Candidatus Saccharibacteria bacterium]|nr:MAG: hypothetical protein IPP75_01120 [Candidatus Saccharibacteria bacterium]
MKKKIYIHAERGDNNVFSPESIIGEKTEAYFNSLEYGDVHSQLFQVWEYPSGRIFLVVPDRVLKPDDYSTPYSTKAVVWQPKLQYVKTDRKLVREKFKVLTSHEQNIERAHNFFTRLMKRK